MQVSAEIRWFWRDEVPGLRDWFLDPIHHGFAPGGGEERIDVYLRDQSQEELGIKLRGVKGDKKDDESKEVEIKGLVSVVEGQLNEGPFVGDIEIWTKWKSNQLTLSDKDSLISIKKRRWLRKFDADGTSLIEIELGADERPLKRQLPDRGCNIEFTEIEIQDNGQVWWSFGFESFANLSTVEMGVRAAAKEIATRNPKEFTGGLLASYPKWLRYAMRESSPHESYP